MAKGEEHVCIGCGVHVTTHQSQQCIFCRGGSVGLPTVTQTQFATNGGSADPRGYPHNEYVPVPRKHPPSYPLGTSGRGMPTARQTRLATNER
jgi:hypothetical protein